MRWFGLLLLGLLAAPLRAQDVGLLVQAARGQVGVTVSYDPSYVTLDFPGGDVPLDRGVCTDVVIKALRAAWGVDLQRAVNRDMKRDFAAYPQQWGLSGPDRNIDHRRVPNLQTLFRRVGAEVAEEGDFQPGDVVSWSLPGNLTHIGILSDQTTGDHPLVLHNIGRGTQEEDILFAFPITGHFRVTPAVLAQLRDLSQR